MKIADVRPVAFWDGRRNWLVIVVETDDALLVCPRDRAQDVRLIVDRLKATGRADQT